MSKKKTLSKAFLAAGAVGGVVTAGSALTVVGSIGLEMMDVVSFKDIKDIGNFSCGLMILSGAFSIGVAGVGALLHHSSKNTGAPARGVSIEPCDRIID